MPDPTSTVDFPFFSAARITGASLLLGLAGLGVLSLSGSHPAPEDFQELTALGDPQFFPAEPAAGSNAGPGAAEKNRVVGSFNGQSFVLTGEKPVEYFETRMVRVGRDAATGLAVYRPVDASEYKHPKNEVLLSKEQRFVKTGPGTFLEVRKR